jgi:membrane-bound ClpP family serine protease
MILILIYVLTLLIGIYAVFNNLPALFLIGIPTSDLKLAKFMVSLFPVIVGGFMIYFSITSLWDMYKKKKMNDKN